MNLKDELRLQQVDHLDLSEFCQVETGQTIRSTVELMRKKKANACLVMDGDELVGIFTVRDILQKVATRPDTWDRLIQTVMTTNPITVDLDHSAADALWLMSEKRVRNLPVVDKKGDFAGTMTHRTIIDYLAARYPIDILNLPPRPDRFPDKVEGG